MQISPSWWRDSHQKLLSNGKERVPQQECTLTWEVLEMAGGSATLFLPSPVREWNRRRARVLYFLTWFFPTTRFLFIGHWVRERGIGQTLPWAMGGRRSPGFLLSHDRWSPRSVSTFTPPSNYGPTEDPLIPLTPCKEVYGRHPSALPSQCIAPSYWWVLACTAGGSSDFQSIGGTPDSS